MDASGHRLRAQLGAAGAGKLQRLCQVLEIQRTGVGAADGHLTADALHLQIVVAPALYIDAALDVRGANQVATPDVQPHVAADARNPHTTAAVDLQVAIHIGHLVIAVAAAALNREALGENDLQVVGDPLVSASGAFYEWRVSRPEMRAWC